jgi:hypothetical protein
MFSRRRESEIGLAAAAVLLLSIYVLLVIVFDVDVAFPRG